jgi:hypothetical protein
MKKNASRKKDPEIKPLPNVPNMPAKTPEITPRPEQNAPYHSSPEITPHPNPEINPVKEKTGK